MNDIVILSRYNAKYFDIGNVSHIFPLIWRFLPGMDSQVSSVLVRDLDSEISKREAEAVEQFQNSDKVQLSFFACKDVLSILMLMNYL